MLFFKRTALYSAQERELMREFMVVRSRNNAERGLKYLDTEHPGWENIIPASVDISCSDGCVVHYLTGQNYARGIHALAIEDPASLGFFVGGEPSSSEVRAEYAMLTTHFRAGRDHRLAVAATKAEFISRGAAAEPRAQQEAVLV